MALDFQTIFPEDFLQAIIPVFAIGSFLKKFVT